MKFEFFKPIIDLFFPKACFACSNYLSDNEDGICVSCRHDLPVTNFHFNNDDTVKNVLRGRATIEQATALLRFEKKGLAQQLIHNLKYKNQEYIGELLGHWLGGELKNIIAYQEIDIVIPVPLHPKKLKQRGYNQVTKFGQSIAKNLGTLYVDDILVKHYNTTSQTKKERLARWQNSTEIFAFNKRYNIEYKHILLVDDIITTGATLEACCEVLSKVKGVKISIATMAIA